MKPVDYSDAGTRRSLIGAFLGGAFVLVLAGCGSVDAPVPAGGGPDGTTTGGTPRTAAGFSQFSDIAVPAGARMDVERSLVLGSRDEWIGRLSMSASGNTTATYDFFLSEMPKFGWQEITSVRSEVSVLTYMRGGRVATVQILARTLGGSQVDVTVSPRGRPMPASSSAAPADMPGSGAVTVSPLR